jgi:hypothetical protein
MNACAKPIWNVRLQPTAHAGHRRRSGSGGDPETDSGNDYKILFMNIIELHSAVWQQLRARRAQLPHALLIAGQRGSASSSWLALFAESLLCEDLAASGKACGKCLACGWLAQGNHPDLRLLQPSALVADAVAEAGEGEETGKKKPSQQITIDQVRRSMTSCMSVRTAMACAWCCSTRPRP